MQEIMVSVICNAYNHEKYIRDALEGFVKQKTSFKFEVLIHDDASTDGTVDIIREYEKNYPDIIKPIYQTENQYSKRIHITTTHQMPRVKGKYIAVCEGDDYWTDPYKLQKQFDVMEKHPEIDVCAHTATMVEANTKNVIKYIRPSKKNTVIPAKRVIGGGGGFVATNSLFYRAEINKNIPEFRKYLMLDYTLQIHSSLRGGMLYIKDCMAAYRYMSDGSWTVRVASQKDRNIEHTKKLLKMLEILNCETDNKYQKTINKITLKHKRYMTYSIALDQQSLEYDMIKSLSFWQRIKVIMHHKSPNVVNKLKKFK